ncbi:MAG TPA: peptidylprolyl isomerase [Isosphaeraceae bacterium]|nr:peptidylprolyl isomerase [Isosphaeraceae bacterium]
MSYLLLAGAAVIGLCFLPITGASGAPDDDQPVVVLETSLGNITIQLDRAKAPKTVENFLKYVDAGFYNNTCFHRVIPNFMIQGGGFPPEAKSQEDAKKTNAPIQNEAGNGLKNLRYTIAMARTSNPHSATAQFFINLNADPAGNAFLDRENAADGWGYAVFGKVIDGTDTVDKIAKVRTTRNDLSPDGCPTEAVVIKSAKRKKAS